MLKLIISYGIPAESARVSQEHLHLLMRALFCKLLDARLTSFTPFFSAKLLAVTCVAMCVLLRAVMTNGSSCTN